MPTEAERVLAALESAVRTSARRKKAPAPAPKKPAVPAKFEPLDVYSLVRDISDVLEQVDIRRPGGLFSDETWASMDELLKAADECYENFADLDIDDALRNVSKLDSEYDKVVDQLKKERDTTKYLAETTFKACDKWATKLRDLETKHPEIGGYQFDQFVREVERLGDEAFDATKV